MDSQHWRFSTKAVVLVLTAYAALLFALLPTVTGVVQRWMRLDESYSHGFLLLAIALGLSFQAWNKSRPKPGFYPLWLVPLSAGLLAYYLGYLLRIQALQELTVVPLLLAVMAVFLGWQQVKRFIIPIGILFFAIPVWDFLSWPLQLITVEINRLLLGLFGIEFRVDGVFVYLIGVGAFEVAHGCSGLRYLLVGQLLAVLYGHLNFKKVRTRLILYLFGVLLALLANWIRVFVIIYMGHETNMQSSLIADHDTFGWWVFAGTLVPLFCIARKLEASRHESVETSLPGGPTQDRKPTGEPWFALATTVGLTLLVFLILPTAQTSVAERVVPLTLEIPRERYSPLFQSNLEGWRPTVKHPDRAYEQTFFDRGLAAGKYQEAPEKVLVGVYSYDFQRPRAELIQYGNRLYDNKEWVLDNFFDVEVSGKPEFKGALLRHRVTGQKLFLAFSYYVEGFWETDELRAKLAQIKGVFNDRSDASLIVFALSCNDCAGKVRVEEVARSLAPEIVSFIDRSQSDG